MWQIILASASRYRRQLLMRLQIPFTVAASQTDETPICGEPPDARALRLAEEKARAVAGDFPQALIIGSDQTIADGDTIFDKPGNKENAAAQLADMCGRQLRFYTAVALLNSADGSLSACLTTHTARFRNATTTEINRYIEKEAAFDCAGGAQIEGLGISLMDDIQGGDPTALIGMSLIQTAQLLRAQDIQIP